MLDVDNLDNRSRFSYLRVGMTKILVDVDDEALADAAGAFGTKIKMDTVNAALTDCPVDTRALVRRLRDGALRSRREPALTAGPARRVPAGGVEFVCTAKSTSDRE